jgi:tetratricopeptide (TPR) repeat protein
MEDLFFCYNLHMIPEKCCKIQQVLFVLAFAAAAATAVSTVASAESRQLHAEALIDSLLSSSAFDSVLTLIPSILEDAEAGKDSALSARLLAVRGRAEIMTGKLAVGIESFDASIELARSVGDTTTWMTALGYKSLAVAWQGGYDECVKLNRMRLELARKTGDRASEAWARTGLGYVHLLRGNLEESRIEYETAVSLFSAENLRQDELTPLIGLGRVFNLMEDIESAREAYTRVWVVARDIGDRVQEAYAVNNLGTLEFEYGNLSLAVKYFERAYHLHLMFGDLRGAITPAVNIALARIYLGQFQGAADVLSQAAQRCREGDFRSLLGDILVKLGEVRYHQGLNHASSELYRESLGIGDALSKKTRNEAVFGLARSLEAVDSTGKAVEILGTALEAPLPMYEIRLKVIMARCLRRLRRPNEALEYLLDIERKMKTRGQLKRLISASELSLCYRELGKGDEALDAFLEAVERLEVRLQFTESLEWREAMGGTRDLVDASSIVLEYPPHTPKAERVEELFNIFQRFKARTLLERITEPRHQTEPSSEFATLPIATLSQLQGDILEEGELFLDFVVGDNTSYLFAVTRDSCREVILPGLLSDLPERVELFLRVIGKPPDSGGSTTGIDVVKLQKSMGTAILGEVADLVAYASHLLIAPDLYFGSLPFGLLIIADGVESREPLFESKAIQYVPSATVLQWLRTEKRRRDTGPHPGAVLALVPVHTEKLAGVEREVEFLQRRYSRVSVAEGEAARTVIDDTGASFEVIHVAAHIEVNDERPWHSGIFLGEPTVSADTVTQARRMKPGKGVLVSATDSTQLDPEDVRRDPYIRAGDIAGRHLRAEMVVLSGCESALGRSHVGEGLSGLMSAFLSAGVPVIVATLWPVDDAVTANVMKEFYLSLDAGLPAAAALREAQIAIRSRRGTRHPFYWAGFVAVGDGNAHVRLEPKQADGFNPCWLVVAGAMVLAGAVIWFQRKKFKKSEQPA